MSRFTVAILAGFLGWLAGSAIVLVEIAKLPNNQAGQPRPELMVEYWLVFLGIAFATGHVTYYLLEMRAEAKELRRWSPWVMAAFNLLAGAWLMDRGWQAAANGIMFQPSFWVGLFLVFMASWDVRQIVKRFRTGPGNEP
jgi:hypothetical protein